VGYWTGEEVLVGGFLERPFLVSPFARRRFFLPFVRCRPDEKERKNRARSGREQIASRTSEFNYNQPRGGKMSHLKLNYLHKPAPLGLISATRIFSVSKSIFVLIKVKTNPKLFSPRLLFRLI